MTTFRQFMRRRHDTLTDFGSDFIGDALADKNFPKISKWDDLYDHVTARGACAEAIEGALDVWHAYMLFLIRNGEYESEGEKTFLRTLRTRRARRIARARADYAEGAATLAAEAGPAYDDGEDDDKPAPSPAPLPLVVDEYDGGEDADGRYRRADGSRIGSERMENDK